MNVDKTAIAIAVAIILLSGGVLIATQTIHYDNDREIDLISRVNEEGSMMVIRTNDSQSSYLSIDDETGTITISETQKNNWGGKVFGTPGNTTIQHKMLETFVTNPYNSVFTPDQTGLGLKFDMYQQGKALSSDTVYYDTTFTSKAVWDQSTYMNGGIIWESVCSAIIYSNPATGKELINSNQLSPGHACCVIAGNHTYLSSHENTVIQFLRGYIEAVDSLNKALADPSSDEYKAIIEAVMTSSNVSETVAKKAVADIKYTYGNDHAGVDSTSAPLMSLRNDVVKFLKQQSKAEVGFDDQIRNMGYTGDNMYVDYANTLVNDKYLSYALGEYQIEERDAQITIASINGDVHQIALQYGMNMGFFQKHKITININGATNGSGVATSIQNNSANIGFMGVPPITLVTVHSELNKLRTYDLSAELTDASGNPLVNTEVKILSSGHEYTGTTNDKGLFKINVYNGTFGVSNGTNSVIQVKINDQWKNINIYVLERVDKTTDLGKLKLEVEV